MRISNCGRATGLFLQRVGARAARNLRDLVTNAAWSDSEGRPENASSLATSRYPTWVRKLAETALVCLLGFALVFTCGGNSDYVDSGSGLLPRLGLFFCLLSLSVFACHVVPAAGVVVILSYLVLFGVLRRLLIPVLGFRDNDPLTLLVPIVAATYMARLILTRRLLMPSTMTKLLGALLVLMAFGLINPLGQAGIVGNIAGSLFYMIPLFWFFYGLSVSTPNVVTKLLNAAIVLGAIAAGYGVFQTFYGFLVVDRIWMDLTNYTQVLDNSTTRVFSTFNGFAEYVYFVAAAALVAWSRFVAGKRPYIFIFVPLFAAIFLSSGRGILLNTLAACVVVVAIQSKSPRNWIPRLAFAAALAGLGLFYGLRQVQQAPVKSPVGKYINHNTELIDSSFATTKSGSAHLTLMVGSVVYGITHPVGRGLAAGTIAEARFSDGSASGGAEFDLGNLFLAVGGIGGGIYLAFCCFALYWSLRLWHLFRHELHLCIVGLLMVQLGQWLTGAHYSVAFLVWFCLGFVARSQIKLQQAATPSRSVRRPSGQGRARRDASDSPSGGSDSSTTHPGPTHPGPVGPVPAV
jgi:hypothetical protein